MTKTLAVEWAPSRIRINAVAPGVIFNESAKAHYASKTNVENMLELVTAATPTRRLGTPEEVSSAVVFLLSPGASYITGINLDVGGASHLTPVPLTLSMKSYDAWPMPNKL
jgi:NAD(P)-dependent dehydrogenase (short-subunit alcohol dehydrogenase family)